MTNYKKQPIPKELRLAVFKRDEYTCRYCGTHVLKPHADHVFPESRGGPTIIENLVTACRDCNNRKRAKVGMWPHSLEHLRNNEITTRLRKSERFQMNIAKGYRQKYKDKVSETKYTWAVVAQRAYIPFTVAYGFTTLNVFKWQSFRIEMFRDWIIFFVGMGVGLLFAAYVYWRQTR